MCLAITLSQPYRELLWCVLFYCDDNFGKRTFYAFFCMQKDTYLNIKKWTENEIWRVVTDVHIDS